MHNEKKDSLVLPRKLGDRILLFAFCSVLTVFFALMTFALHGRATNSWLDILLHGLGLDTMLTFSIFSFLAMIWSLFTPRWMESLMNQGFRKVLTTIGVILVATVFTILYYAI
jgi:magnesium-transporting ATPase (P-type)